MGGEGVCQHPARNYPQVKYEDGDSEALDMSSEKFWFWKRQPDFEMVRYVVVNLSSGDLDWDRWRIWIADTLVVL